MPVRESAEDKPWMRSFGKLRVLHKETVRINRLIEAEFGRVEPDPPAVHSGVPTLRKTPKRDYC